MSTFSASSVLSSNVGIFLPMSAEGKCFGSFSKPLKRNPSVSRKKIIGALSKIFFISLMLVSLENIHDFLRLKLAIMPPTAIKNPPIQINLTIGFTYKRTDHSLLFIGSPKEI